MGFNIGDLVYSIQGASTDLGKNKYLLSYLYVETFEVNRIRQVETRDGLYMEFLVKSKNMPGIEYVLDIDKINKPYDLKSKYVNFYTTRKQAEESLIKKFTKQQIKIWSLLFDLNEEITKQDELKRIYFRQYRNDYPSFYHFSLECNTLGTELNKKFGLQ